MAKFYTIEAGASNDEVKNAMLQEVLKPIARLLASAAVKIDKQITGYELDKMLDGSSLSVHQRIEIKTGLSRVGVLL